MYFKKKSKNVLNIACVIMLVMVQFQPDKIIAANHSIRINEVESNGDTPDWVEVYNTSDVTVDISGWYLYDNDPAGHKDDVIPVIENTVLQPHQVYVFDQDQAFNFGLGANDCVTLYDHEGNIVDEYSWTQHATGTYSRVPDGVGEFIDQEATKAKSNIIKKEELPAKLVINEVDTAPTNWIEVMNVGDQDLNISNYELRDNSNDHRFRFQDSTVLKAKERFVVESTTIGLVYNDQTGLFETGEFQAAIALGASDSIRLYEPSEELIDSFTWTSHAKYQGDEVSTTYSRYPDGVGDFVVSKDSKGLPNDWYKPTVEINEVESDGDITDWVEVYNTGDTAVDISGWYIYDNDPVGHKSDIVPVAANTLLQPHQVYVFDQNQAFSFGLGANDSVTLYDKNGNIVCKFNWIQNASGVYARIPDGTGVMQNVELSTKGRLNINTSPVVLNEIKMTSNGGLGWIELANPTMKEIDISGLKIRDSQANTYTIANNTKISAYGFLVLTQQQLQLKLDGTGELSVYDEENRISNCKWTEVVEPSFGLFPDTAGNEYRKTKVATPGASNQFDGVPNLINWPGIDTIQFFDTTQQFLSDSSGLDFSNGKLYAVDNGTGMIWILNVAKDGTLTFDEGYQKGKRVRFQKDANNLTAAGPDAEGISVDRDGFVYIASERDNSAKKVNYNTILKVDPKQTSSDLIAQQEWDLTSTLPNVEANLGIEAVEWVANEDVEGKLFDKNLGKVFNANNYPKATANGVFFVAMEANGHVYAYILNNDNSVTQIADIDSQLGGVMALDYDEYNHNLWMVADNGYQNKAARLTFTSHEEVDITHILPPKELDTSANNEGFAIAQVNYTKDGQRPVYRFQDGVESNALSIGGLNSLYQEDQPIQPKPDKVAPVDTADPTARRFLMLLMTGSFIAMLMVKNAKKRKVIYKS